MAASGVAAAVLAATSPASVPGAKRGSGRPDSGIRGDVTLGPTCPVQRAGQNCTRPYRATIRIRRRSSGRVVASPRSDAAGHFSARLAAGRYRLEPVGGHPFPRAPSQDVAVHAHRFTHVTVRYDTGIR